MDFDGLPLTSLEIRYGSGDQNIDFSYPNPQEMQRLKVTADSGTVVIENLAHANAAEIRLNGDATSPPHGSAAQDFIHAEKAFWNKAAREQQEALLTIHCIAQSISLHLRYLD